MGDVLDDMTSQVLKGSVTTPPRVCAVLQEVQGRLVPLHLCNETFLPGGTAQPPQSVCMGPEGGQDRLGDGPLWGPIFTRQRLPPFFF